MLFTNVFFKFMSRILMCFLFVFDRFNTYAITTIRRGMERLAGSRHSCVVTRSLQTAP